MLPSQGGNALTLEAALWSGLIIWVVNHCIPQRRLWFSRSVSTYYVASHLERPCSVDCSNQSLLHLWDKVHVFFLLLMSSHHEQWNLSRIDGWHLLAACITASPSASIN
jgi:hypothetical protein